MTLTVPTAGVTAGRAAQPRFEAPQTGAVLAAFGQVVKGAGDRLEADRLDLAAGRLQLDMTRDLNALRLKYEAVGDPDAIDRGWAEDIGALRETYLAGTDASGRARVDPKLRDRFGLMFDDLAEKHAFALSGNVLALRQSQRVATQIEYAATASQAVAAADPATAGEIYVQFDQRVDELAAQGVYTPEQAATEKLAFRQSGEFERGMWLLQNDPEGLREALDGGLLPSLPPDQRRRLEAGYTAQLEKEADAAKADAAAITASWKSQLGEGLAIIEKGGRWSGELLLSDPAVQAALPDDVARVRGALSFREEAKNVDRMPLAQLQAERDALAATPLDQSWQTDRLAYLDERIAKVGKAMSTDPSGFWQAQAPDLLPPLDLSSPEAAAASIRGRIARSDQQAEAGRLPKGAYLSEAEKAQLTAALSATAAPEARLALLSALSTVGGEKAAALAGMAGASPASRQALHLMASGAEPATVLPMLRGETKLGFKVASGPAAAAMNALVNEVTHGVHAEDPEVLQRITEGALGFFADGMGTIDPEDIKEGYFSDGPARTLALDAISMAMGAQRDPNGRFTIGGVQEIRDAMVPLPRGVSAIQLEKVLDRVTLELRGVSVLSESSVIKGATLAEIPETDPAKMAARATEGQKAELPAPDIFRTLKAAAVFAGQVPDLGANGADPAAAWEEVQILPARQFNPAIPEGSDVYVLVRHVGGQPYFITDATGKTYSLSLSKLVGSTRE